MKKILSVLLAVVMLALTMMPLAYAAEEDADDAPLIMIRGAYGQIVDEEDNAVFSTSFDNYDTSNLSDDIVEVCWPHLLKGMVTGNYDDYKEALESKLNEVYAKGQCDENGDPRPGTGRSKEAATDNYNYSHADSDYVGTRYFAYDWRLDPYVTAAQLNEFINNVIQYSGCKKVSLIGRCLGASLVSTYLKVYGTDKVKSVIIDEGAENGVEIYGYLMAGKLNLNTDAIMRWLKTSDMDIEGNMILSVLTKTLEMLNSTGSSDRLMKLFMNTVYDQLGEIVISAFMKACYGTFPMYWTMVKSEDFEDAKTLVFGEEGSSDREKYAGLIAKIDKYHNEVGSHITDIFQSVLDSGNNLAIIAKYGYQILPYVECYDELSDSWITTTTASLGATTAKIGKTLSDEYIAERTEAGYGKYISADKEVDASTCAFPEYTWFLKDNIHDDLSEYECSFFGFIADSNHATVETDPRFPQFAVYDEETDFANPLTAENQGKEIYADIDTGSTANMNFIEKIVARFEAFSAWIKLVFSAVFG